jgi:gamma-glutamylcyclotransferase
MARRPCRRLVFAEGSDNRMWYFAYGSNMQSDTLRGRRGIAFGRAVTVRAPGWRVVFDKPPLFPIGEAFANIVPDPDAAALGVAFEVGEEELAHIALSEGVLLGNYRRVLLDVEALAPHPEAPRTAVSLASDRRDATLRPSRRYMALVVAGAREHGLPNEYVDALRAVPACESTAVARAFRPLLDAGLRRWKG